MSVCVREREKEACVCVRVYQWIYIASTGIAFGLPPRRRVDYKCFVNYSVQWIGKWDGIVVLVDMRRRAFSSQPVLKLFFYGCVF